MRQSYAEMDLNNKLISNLWDISHTMKSISEGKGSQKRILITLEDSGPITQSGLTEYLHIQPGSVSEVLGKMEHSGLIRRTPSQADQRTSDLTLTEMGRKEAKEAALQRQQRQNTMFSGLTEEEKEILLHLLEKLNGDWRQKFQSRERHRRGHGHELGGGK